MEDNRILTINGAGKVRRVHQDKLTKLENETIAQIAIQFKDPQQGAR